MKYSLLFEGAASTSDEQELLLLLPIFLWLYGSSIKNVF